jgi:hypothetical protein
VPVFAILEPQCIWKACDSQRAFVKGRPEDMGLFSHIHQDSDEPQALNYSKDFLFNDYEATNTYNTGE